MKIKIKNRDYIICDICENEEKIQQKIKECIFCKKDICKNHLKGESFCFDSDNWNISDEEKGICPSCYDLLNRYRYFPKPSSWKSTEKKFKKAFLEIYNREIRKTKDEVAKKMRKMLCDYFEEIKKTHQNKAILEKKKKEYEKQIKKLEEKMSLIKKQ